MTNPKTVRFAYKNTFHSPPATPIMGPMTYPSSSVPSSLGVITPPSPYYDTLPTPTLAHRVRVHPYLEVDGITWDMLEHPNMLSRHHKSISSRAWKESATTPPMPVLVITIHDFPWRFEVHASNGSYVSFEDVVTKIYNSLRKNITESDFHTAATPSHQRRATQAYEQRYRRLRHTIFYEEEKRGGMKRVDFLMEHTRFGGLYNSSRHPNEWRLSIN